MTMFNTLVRWLERASGSRCLTWLFACVLLAAPVCLWQPAWAQDVAASAAAAQAAAPGLASAVVEQQVVDNPYGLGALWAQGDFVSKGTLVILVLMSMASWYILVTKLYASFQIAADARLARNDFFKASSLQSGAQLLKDGSPFRYIAQNGIDADERHEGSLTANIDRNTWVTMSVQRSIDEVQSRLQDGLAVLATVGSTAPFIGLFGTVWGIYHALTAIGIAGQASIDKVAGPVGEALIMTAIGLAVAVPAVLGYNWLVRRNKITMDAVRGFGADLHGILMGAKGVR
jgi:biopolymer transport protein ExbB